MSHSYEPQFKGPIEGYVVNGMRANFFRVEATMTREDYMQEAYEVFLTLKHHYAGKVEEPKHFMALFKSAWYRRLADLSNEDTNQRELFRPDHTMHRSAEGEEERQYEALGEMDNEGHLHTLIRQAPSEVAMVLNLFLSAPQELLEVALRSWSGNKDRRRKDGGSARVCQLLGLDPSRDVMQEVHDYLSA